jgi:hypothetical protein
MVEIKDPSVFDREKHFVADEISFVNFVISDYSNPVAPDPKEYAIFEYDNNKITLVENMRRKRIYEADS